MSSPKKKLTKKEQKALNHANLMASKKGGISVTSSNEHGGNVVDITAFQKAKDKKAA